MSRILLSSDQVVKDCYFERMVADCTILPFKDDIFDIIFCKELIHHLGNPMDLLNEVSRLCSPGGIIVLLEPCTSIFLVDRMTTIEKASIKSEIGIKHYKYTYYDYLNYMGSIATEIQIRGRLYIIDEKNKKFLNILQKPVIYLSQFSFLKNIIIKLHLIIIGGSMRIIGVKKENYTYEGDKRELTPIPIHSMNLNQINFYRNKLIPKVFKIFSKTHEKI